MPIPTEAPARAARRSPARGVVASLTALIVAAGLSLAGISAVSADELTEAPATESYVAEAPAAEPVAVEPSAPAAEVPAPSAPESAPAPAARAASAPAAQAAPYTKVYYHVAIYVYKKVDPKQPASWPNSGLQTLVGKKTGTEWYTKLSPYNVLPAGVCGDGWAVQQDKVATTDPNFQWPQTIQYPVDSIGWPPLYDAKHQNLTEITSVPACAPEKVIPGDPSGSVAQCVDGTVTTGSITVGGETGLVYTITGTGSVSNIVIDPVTSVVTSGLPVGSYIVSVKALPGFVLDGAAEWPVTVAVTTPVDCVQLPDHPVIPTNATATPPYCSTKDGAIVLGQVGGTSFFEGVTYFIDGKAATSSTVSLPAGTYTVTVVADPGNGLDGLDTFSVTIPASPAVCGELTTLALTGSNPAPWLIGALALLLAGAVAITVTRVRQRDLAEAPQV